MLHGRTPWPANNELELINGIYNKKITFSNDISEKSKDFIRNCLEIYEENRMSWEEAFAHRLLQENTRKSMWLDSGVAKELFEEEIDCSLVSKLKSLNNVKPVKNEDKSFGKTYDKENRSPLNGKKKDISGNKCKKNE